MPKIDLTEIEAAFNRDQDEADALILERWDAHLKKHPVKAGTGIDLEKIRAGLQQHHGGPGPHKSGSSQDVHGGDRGGGADEPAGKGKSKKSSVFPTRPASEPLTDEQKSDHYLERTVPGSDEEVLVKESKEPHNKGHFQSFRVEVEGNGRAILKTDYDDTPFGDEKIKEGFAKREVAAYQVDQALGLDVVPETIGVENALGAKVNKKYKYQSLQTWVENSKIGWDTYGAGVKQLKPSDMADPTEIGKTVLLDKIMGHSDRHGANWLLTDDMHIRAIDNGLGFIWDSDDPYWRGGIGDMYKAFDIDLSANNPKVLRPYLPRSYRDTLRSAIDSGALYKAISTIGTDDVGDRMTSAALFRAENIYNNWDTYFSDDNWYGD